MKSHSQKRKSSEMQLARGRLKGVLQEMVTNSDEENDIEEVETSKKSSILPLRGRPPKNKKEIGITGVLLSPKKSKAIIQNDQQSQEIQPSTNKTQVQESFVMKLFDRSLDLSKYDENTGLYPICRAWMANTPRSPSIPSYRRMNVSTTPLIKRNIDPLDLLKKLQKGEIFDVTSLPAPDKSDLPKICPTNLEEIKNSRDSEIYTDHEDLLSTHIIKWKAIRKNWQKHSKEYQQRYEKNYQIIKELFKP